MAKKIPPLKPIATYVYIAVSWLGHPTPFCGYAFTAQDLRQEYASRFAHTLKQAGYHVVKVRMVQA